MPIEKPATVNLAPETKKEVLSALRDIRQTLSVESSRGKTVSGKMAEKLAETPGRGLFSALKESIGERIGEKTDSFKKMLDPVSIIKSMTGGSKLAGVLTAKALGRSEEDIRKEAGLGSITNEESIDTSAISPTELGGGMSNGVDELLKTLNIIAVRVDSIAGAMGAKAKVSSTGQLYNTTEKGARFLGGSELKQESAILNTLLEIKQSQLKSVDLETDILNAEQDQSEISKENAKLAEEASDTAREFNLEKSRRPSSPTLAGMRGMGGMQAITPTTKAESGSGIGETITGALGLIGGGLTIGKTLKTGYEGAKNIGGKLLEKVGLKTAAPVAAEAGKTAAKTATKEGIKSKIAKVIAKKAPKALMGTIGKSIPVLGAAVGIGMALNRLVKGDMVGAGLEAVSGLGSAATAIPATVASLVRDVYTESYGIEPENDPMRGERFPELQQMVQTAATDFIQGKSETAPTPEGATPTPTPEGAATSTPTVSTDSAVVPSVSAEGEVKQPESVKPSRRTDGEKIDEMSKNVARTKEMPTNSKTSGGSVSNNIVNNNHPQTVIMSGMPQPRGSESTWLRRQQQNYPTT